MKTIFGPVPSRRLGRSLGIDVISPKTCSYDCLYCESGRTTHLTIQRQAEVDPDHVLHDLEDYFRDYPNGAQVLTFSSAGEPTLYEPLGYLIRTIKKRFPSLPLIVLTNGSLLWDDGVRQDLMAADRVAPTLSSITETVFREIHRPHPSLNLTAILDGLYAFRQDYRGELNLEIMLVSGFNHYPEELRRLRQVIDRLQPDSIELNTIVRPPAVPTAQGLSPGAMEEALRFFSLEKTRIIGCFQSPTDPSTEIDLDQRVVQMVKRRPCTLDEMAASLGTSQEGLRTALTRLDDEGHLTHYCLNGIDYFCSTSGLRGEESCPTPSAEHDSGSSHR